jgi:hypothetical protein
MEDELKPRPCAWHVDRPFSLRIHKRTYAAESLTSILSIKISTIEEYKKSNGLKSTKAAAPLCNSDT